MTSLAHSMHCRSPAPSPFLLTLLRAGLLYVGLLGACSVGKVGRLDAEAAPSSEPARPLPAPDTESAEIWFRQGAEDAAMRGAYAANARNLILFVGDGMSLPTVAAARILEGQRHGHSGEENELAWESFPATALVKTYNTDAQTPDSAGTITAMIAGVKTRKGVLSVDQNAVRGDCASARAASVLTLWELAATSNFATGIVTTTRLTHATPAATFAHTPERDWESDADLPVAASTEGCLDIARQMIETRFGLGADVMLGGGRAYFLGRGQADPEYPEVSGRRIDERDLVKEWLGRHPDGHYVWTAAQLAAAPDASPVFGLFEPDHMRFEHDRPQDPGGEPSLAQMTRAAILRLQAISRRRGDEAGYVLLVEAGRIDHAHHYGNAYRALTDTLALSDAVRVADAMTSVDDTLIMVTADHSHTLTFAGYPVRGNPILGKVRGASDDKVSAEDYARDALALPYTTLSYANGPGYAGASTQQPEGPKRYRHLNAGTRAPQHGRPDLSHVDTEAPDYLQEATLPLEDETHGGEDVALWARGPGSHAVRGSIEQNVIFHLLLQAQPFLRLRLCEIDECNAQGVPRRLPSPAAILRVE